MNCFFFFNKPVKCLFVNKMNDIKMTEYIIDKDDEIFLWLYLAIL